MQEAAPVMQQDSMFNDLAMQSAAIELSRHPRRSSNPGFSRNSCQRVAALLPKSHNLTSPFYHRMPKLAAELLISGLA